MTTVFQVFSLIQRLVRKKRFGRSHGYKKFFKRFLSTKRHFKHYRMPREVFKHDRLIFRSFHRIFRPIQKGTHCPRIIRLCSHRSLFSLSLVLPIFVPFVSILTDLCSLDLFVSRLTDLPRERRVVVLLFKILRSSRVTTRESYSRTVIVSRESFVRSLNIGYREIGKRRPIGGKRERTERDGGATVGEVRGC